MGKRLPYSRMNQIVFEYLHRFSIHTFIETGTYKGGGIYNALGQAKEVYSIELDEKRFLNAQAIFERFPNVQVIHGDSGKVLPEIMPKLKGRCLFWLDAHYGNDEAQGEPRTPILDELKCVLNYPDKCVILIDDARMYNGKGDWPTLETLKTIILESHPEWDITVKDDIIVVVPDNISPIAEDKFISMSTLGRYGRFGNQLFQYAALKMYAWTHGLRVEVPADWIGRRVFMGCNDISISDKPRNYKTLKGDCIWLNGERLEKCDVKGYCQYHTSVYDKDYFQALFQFISPLKKALNEPITPLREGNLIGLHIRLTDYRLPGRNKNIAPIQWYLDWLRENWGRFDNPHLFVASDEINNVIHYFSEYKPDMFSANANFLYDFHTLSQCDCLLISNSTFSFAAAMLNEQGSAFYRPDFDQEKMVSFDPWNSKPLLEPI